MGDSKMSYLDKEDVYVKLRCKIEQLEAEIERQKAEIERLKTELDSYKSLYLISQ